MGNIGRLTDAGIIPAAASLSQEDQDVINSLTPDEVSALISIKAKLPAGFVQRNLSPSAAAGGKTTIGIVF